MEETTLLSLPEGMRIEQIQITENGLVIAVVATTPTSCSTAPHGSQVLLSQPLLRAQNLCRAPAHLGGAVGQGDHSVLPADYRSRASHLW